MTEYQRLRGTLIKTYKIITNKKTCSLLCLKQLTFVDTLKKDLQTTDQQDLQAEIFQSG